nr:hypothetical protein [uncultured Schaedlerella sp.]
MNAMTEARFCEHIIFLAHAPLRVYDKSGVRKAVYVDHGEQIDILEADPAFEKMLLEKKREEFPILYTEQVHIAYGIIAGKERDYILGPCCMDGRPSATVRFLKEKHGLDAGTPYRIGYIDQYELSELIVMLYEMVTGNLFDKNQLMIVSSGNPMPGTGPEVPAYEAFRKRSGVRAGSDAGGISGALPG